MSVYIALSMVILGDTISENVKLRNSLGDLRLSCDMHRGRSEDAYSILMKIRQVGHYLDKPKELNDWSEEKREAYLTGIRQVLNEIGRIDSILAYKRTDEMNRPTEAMWHEKN